MKRQKISTETFSILAVGFLIGALILTILYSIFSGLTYIKNEESLEKANQRLYALNTTLSSIKDAETGQRGFLLTGRDTYLTPYNKALKDIEDALTLLRIAYTNDLNSQSKIDEFTKAKDLKIAELASTISIYKTKGSQAALQIVLTDNGKDYMDFMREILSNMINKERFEHKNLTAATTLQFKNSETGYIFLGILTFCFSVAMSFFIYLSGRQKRKLVAKIEKDFEIQSALQQELEATNTHLAQKVAELDEFTYIASHDLQEPLRKLVSFSELLKSDLPEDLPERASADLRYIVDAGYRMQTLIRDLLDFSRIGRRDMMSRNCNLDACLNRALEDLSLIIEEKQAHIEHVQLPEVFGDDSMLTHIFFNLIGNALKFIPSDRKPHIKIEARQESTFWVIEVSDNGIGISPKYYEQIFGPFKRLHGKDEYAGSGIGLAICKKIAERHGGSIGIRSEVGVGSCFFFTLPIEKQDHLKGGTQ